MALIYPVDRSFLETNDSSHDMVCCIRLYGMWRNQSNVCAVVKTPEDAASRKAPFDYVLLCVKALPDVYDLAAVIEPVVTPQHTCILVNTTHTLGVESHLEQRFPTNVVLSLVSGAEITQLGASEFEHLGATDVWVGPANKNAAIPPAIQNDMAEALAMTLTTGRVDCQVSSNIRQQQYERMIGYATFWLIFEYAKLIYADPLLSTHLVFYSKCHHTPSCWTKSE